MTGQANPTTGIDPANNATGQPGGDGKLYAGKYKTPEELEKGYAHQFVETQAIIAERDEWKRRTEALALLTGDEGSGRMNPAQRADARKSKVEELAEAMNVQPILLAGALGEVATVIFEPLNQAINANQRITQEVPDYRKYEPEVQQFLATHPSAKAEYDSLVEANKPLAAMKLAYFQYANERNNATVTPPNNATTADTTGKTAAAALLDAAVPGAGSRGPAGQLTDAAAKLEELRQHGLKTGQWGPYLTAKIGYQTPEWHLLGSVPQEPKAL